MDQFLENRQNYMMDNNSMQHMNVASADCDAVVGALQAEVVSAGVGGVTSEILGGKYDEHQEEHDVGDDDELKYVKEVQQSEKQQPQLQTLKNFSQEDDDGTYECNELAEKETSNNAAHEFGNGGFVFGGDHQQQPQQHRDLFNMGNGHDTNGHDNVNVNINEEFGNLVSTGFEKKLHVMKSEIDGVVPQVDVKIETKEENQAEMIDEDEPSSLATNTTNGTSSLSENVPPQAVVAPLSNIFDDFMSTLENIENSDPLTPQIPNELDLEQAQSQLNPDAKEFVPNFGSNPSSPTSPFATGLEQQNETILSDIMETQIFGQAPSVVPRHLLGDDDFVAQSPRKGKDDNNMDTVSLPKELSEFEQEADKRPHELELQDIDGFHQRDEVMTPDQATQQLPLDDVEIQDTENEHLTDSTDFQPSNFMDHGPETCVDLDADLDVQPSAVSSLQHDDDVMKRSMYVATDDAIEDVLNSVQPIPTEIDSVNNSFIEESATESAANQLAGDKELLQIEEKENVSHSPSTEEIQMNLQNTLNCSNKDIPQLTIDMDNEKNMQESMYLEQEAQLELDEEHDKQFRVEEQKFKHEQMSNEQPQVEEQHLKETIHHEEQQEQGELEEDIQTQMDKIHLQQDLLAEQSQNEDETHIFQEELITEKQPEEPQHDLQKDEQEHFKNQVESEPHQDQQLSEPLSLDQHEEIHDLDQQPNQDLMADTSTNLAEESLLADTTNPLIANDSFLYNSPATQEQQQEIHESFSPFKISDEVSNAPAAMESLHFDAPECQQETNLNDGITTTSYTADEKHLLEETKEQPLFSMTGLEQQMGEMMLNNTDGHLSQAEKVAATTAVTAIEDISEQLITPDEAVISEEQYEHHHRQELEQTQDQMFADDSFFQNEQKYLKQYQQEQEDNKEMEIVKQEQIDPETENVLESIESPFKQQHQHQLEFEFESEMVAVEEPIIEAKQTAPLFTTNEETEILNETKIDEYKGNMEEIPPSMVHETASAELLEQQSITTVKQNETDIVKNGLEEKPAQEAIEEIKTEITEKIPELEEVNTNEEECVKEVVATPEIKPDIPVEAAVGAATVAVASIAAVAAKVASAPSNNKADTAKKSLSKTTTTAAKTKVASAPAAKKPIEATKKPVGLAAKPRAAPAKPASTTADKKPIAKTTLTTATTAARKPLSATTTATSKVVAKTTTPTSTTRTVTAASKTTTTSRPTTAPRTTTTTTTAARKPTTSTNGPSAKPRPATAPAKPTTLGLSATNGAPKTKPTSPRSTLSSQVRKTASVPAAAKSPVKSTATNGVNKTASTLATRTKTTTSTVSSTAGTAGKTFTARPAPKFNSSANTTTTTTTTKRLTVGGITTSSTTTSKTSSSPMRKSSPTKSSAGRTPTKSTTTAGSLKSKAPATKTSSATPPSKPAPIRKPVDKTAAVINGDANANKDLNGTVEKIAAPAEEQQQAIPHNGDLQAVQQNGDTNIPMQTEEQQQQSYLESRNEQIPMDLINA